MVCLLWELNANASLQCLKMETDAKASGKTKRKLSFCPFCQYSGSKDPSYLNHIVCAHYVSYGCRKCLDEVFLTGQWLTMHMKPCKGLTKDEAKEKPATSHTKGASSSSSNSKKKKKHKTKSQQPDLQQESQTLLPTSSQASLHIARTTADATRKKMLPPLQKSHTPAAKIQGRSVPQATSTPAKNTRCTSLTNTRRRSNVASPGQGDVHCTSPLLLSVFVDFSSYFYVPGVVHCFFYICRSYLFCAPST